MVQAHEHDKSCECLTCKLAAWRSGRSSLGVHIPEGWRGPSVLERERRHVAELKQAGVEFERAPTG